MEVEENGGGDPAPDDDEIFFGGAGWLGKTQKIKIKKNKKGLP